MVLLLSDDRMIEYGFSKVLFSKQSPFQHVQIVETNDFGRLLNLDRMTNLAESDTQAYTHTLMNLPVENYEVGFVHSVAVACSNSWHFTCNKLLNFAQCKRKR